MGSIARLMAHALFRQPGTIRKGLLWSPALSRLITVAEQRVCAFTDGSNAAPTKAAWSKAAGNIRAPTGPTGGSSTGRGGGGGGGGQTVGPPSGPPRPGGGNFGGEPPGGDG